jgi:exodeoxyribonuclease VII large subunit
MRLDTLREKLMHTETFTAKARTRFHNEASRFTSLMRSTTRNLDSRLLLDENALSVSMKKILADNEQRRQQYLEALRSRINTAKETKTNELGRSAALLDAYSPLKVLSRGYSITMKDGGTVRSIHDVQPSDTVTVRVSDGLIHAEVTGTEEKDGR